MQLNLAFLEPLEPPSNLAQESLLATAWDQLDEAARMVALEVLARLIARMVAAQPARETSDE